jgi:RNA polymerase sigma-70 factor (ECF subfamily)
VPAANSALQRARATLARELPERPAEPSRAELTADEQRLLDGFIDAHVRADAAAAVALAREDIRVTMPPHPMVYDGVDAIRPLIESGLTEHGEWRLVPTRANRMPAAASYLRAWDDTEFRAFKIDVLRCADGGIAEITTFDARLFAQFGLPPVLGVSRASGATPSAGDGA